MLVKRLFVVAVKVRQQLCDNLHVHGDLRVRQKTADIRGLAVNHHFRADVPAARDRAVRQIHRLNRHAEERRRQVAARLLNRLLHVRGEEVRQAQDDRGVLVGEADGVNAGVVHVAQAHVAEAQRARAVHRVAVGVGDVARVLVQLGFRADAQQHLVRLFVPRQRGGEGARLVVRRVAHDAAQFAVREYQLLLCRDGHEHLPPVGALDDLLHRVQAFAAAAPPRRLGRQNGELRRVVHQAQRVVIRRGKPGQHEAVVARFLAGFALQDAADHVAIQQPNRREREPCRVSLALVLLLIRVGADGQRDFLDAEGDIHRPRQIDRVAFGDFDVHDVAADVEGQPADKVVAGVGDARRFGQGHARAVGHGVVGGVRGAARHPLDAVDVEALLAEGEAVRVAFRQRDVLFRRCVHAVDDHVAGVQPADGDGIAVRFVLLGVGAVGVGHGGRRFARVHLHARALCARGLKGDGQRAVLVVGGGNVADFQPGHGAARLSGDDGGVHRFAVGGGNVLPSQVAEAPELQRSVKVRCVAVLAAADDDGQRLVRHGVALRVADGDNGVRRVAFRLHTHVAAQGDAGQVVLIPQHETSAFDIQRHLRVVKCNRRAVAEQCAAARQRRGECAVFDAEDARSAVQLHVAQGRARRRAGGVNRAVQIPVLPVDDEAACVARVGIRRIFGQVERQHLRVNGFNHDGVRVGADGVGCVIRKGGEEQLARGGHQQGHRRTVQRHLLARQRDGNGPRRVAVGRVGANHHAGEHLRSVRQLPLHA